MPISAILNITYLISAVMFIIGLKMLAHPNGALKGNLVSAVGMLLAVVVTLLDRQIVRYNWIIYGIVIGSVIGIALALTIKMTAMPQLVGLFNGFGGLASLLVAGGMIYRALMSLGTDGLIGGNLQFRIATVASGLVGAVTFLGSLVAFAKLQGLITEKPLRYPGEQIVKILLLASTIVFGILFIIDPTKTNYFWYLAIISSILGIQLVMPIGGADAPVVIALLNSYSGIAAAATGFVLSNSILIISGALVGASGIILTKIMCRAMNRSLVNVLFGGVGAVATNKDDQDKVYAGKVTSTSAEEVALLLKPSRRVAFVPGYGMAVARAQSPVRALTDLMEKDGIEVTFGIHPVAGRMPGHMNVLLAEENISYEKLKDMDTINLEFSNIDVVIVLGANDVVNPVARQDTNSPIAGMPIMDVDKAHTVVVVKRSLSPGFAGIANPLFALDNTLMLFQDGKKAMEEIISAYKEA